MPKVHEESTLERKEPCPGCGGSKSLGVYSDGHTYCFKCGKVTRENVSNDAGEVAGDTGRGGDAAPGVVFLEGDPAPLPKRRITLATCKRWGYLSVPGKGQVAQYRGEGGTLVAQKVRGADKKFFSVGQLRTSLLYGKHLWAGGGKRLAIVEGELDAMSLDQTLGKTWPVVSVPTGAKGASECLKANLEWLLTFEEIVLGLDNDTEGKAATEECVKLFPPGRVKVMQYGDLKDASDFLQADRVKDLANIYWRAAAYRPEGITSIADLAPRLRDKIAEGLPWKHECMTRMTYGRRPGELYGFGAGAGIGKTDLFTENIAFTAVELNQPCGVLFLEQPPIETARRIGGKLVKRRLHVPDSGWSEEDITKAEELLLRAPIHLYDHFGSTEWEPIKNRIRFMAVGLGCKHIFLDHLTALAAMESDENEALKKIMAELAGMAMELQFCLYFVSHLATPEGRPHEEGGRVMLRHFRGSRAIGFWTHYAFGLERNPQAEDPAHRRMTRLRCIKDRFTGEANGATAWFSYDTPTGCLIEGAEGYDIDSLPKRGPGQVGAESYGF